MASGEPSALLVRESWMERHACSLTHRLLLWLCLLLLLQWLLLFTRLRGIGCC